MTIDVDTSDVELYGQLKQGVAVNHQGQRVGRPYVATWAHASVVLAADLGDARDDPCASCADVRGRALAALPARARAGRIRLHADAGYFAGQLARAALYAAVDNPVAFTIGARRTAPCGGCSTACRATVDRRGRDDRRAGLCGRLLTELVAGGDAAADPPGPA